MIRTRVLLVFLGLCLVFTPVGNVSALGLKLAPLEYRTTLKKNERKTGFIDISNPSGQEMSVNTSVQGFKQTNDDGGLQFYSDPQIDRGITTDLNAFNLGPREAIRMYFDINGAELPQGDVYAAVFFTTQPKKPRNGVGQLVRVGTLLSIVNATPGSRDATITGVTVPLLQLSDTVQGTYSIKNTAKTGGFYPSVEISSWPGNKKETKSGSLVFAGRERQNDFEYETGYGIHRVEVTYDTSKKSQWVVTLAPWMLVVALLMLLIVGVELLLLKKRRSNSHKKKSRTPDKLL